MPDEAPAEKVVPHAQEPNANDTPRQPTKTTVRELLSQAWFVAAVPGMGYLLVFAYEYGLTKPFGLPPELIRPDLTHVLVLSFFAPVVLWFLYTLVNLAIGTCSIFGISPNHPGIRILLRHSVTFGIAVWFWASGGVGKIVLGFCTILVFSVVADFVFPLYRRGSGTYSNSLLRHLPIAGPDPLSRVLSAAVGNVLYCVVWFVAGLAITAKTGEWIARQNSGWWIPHHNTNAVLVRIYGDSGICVPVNWTNNTADRAFFILDMNNEERNRFTFRKLGRLRFFDAARNDASSSNIVTNSSARP